MPPRLTLLHRLRNLLSLTGFPASRQTIATVLLLACAGITQAGQKPNIVFFLVDDMGWQETSVPFSREPTQLNRDYRTPNMEKLAKESLLFTNAYACAICSPSRVSLMTGQNAARHKVTCWTLEKDKSPSSKNDKLIEPEWNLNGLQPIGTHIPHTVEAITLPELLRQAGYRTIHAGKAHFGAKDTPGANPKALGFDVNIAGSYMGGPGSYYGDKNFSASWRGGGHIWDIPGLDKYHGQPINLTEALTREVTAELETTVAKKQPFYLYFAHYAIHAPWEPDLRYLKNYEGKGWPKQKEQLASMIESMDHSLGDLLATLDRLGVTDNTIIVFASDNGSPKQCPANKPLRGNKISGYEGGSRVPMIVRWPGVTKGETRTDTPVIIEDIFPTFLEFAGVTKQPKVDGVSFVDILKQPATDRSNRPLFWHYPNFYSEPPFSSVRQGDLKLLYWHASRKIELFDLKNDIGETKDLATNRPDDVKRLAGELSTFLRETKANMPIEKASGKPIPYPDEVVP